MKNIVTRTKQSPSNTPNQPHHPDGHAKERYGRVLWYVVALAVIMIAAGHAARYAAGNSTLAGSQAYYHLHLAQQAVSGNPNQDTSIVDGRAVYLTPYHYLAGHLGLVVDPTIVARLLAWIFGIAALVVFAFLLRQAQDNIMGNLVALAMAVLSPAYISMALGSPETMAVFFTIAGLFLLLKPEGQGRTGMLARSIGTATLLVASLFSIFNGMLAIMLASIAAKKEKLPKMWVGVMLVLIAGLYLVVRPPLYPVLAAQPANPLITLISDFGGWTGFSVFFWILAAIGMIDSWKEKQSYALLYGITLCLLAATIFLSQDINRYNVFLLSVFAARGILRLHHSKWSFHNLQTITLIIIVCGLLFSTVSYLNRHASEPPGESFKEAMLVLRDTSSLGDRIASHPTNGYSIEALANRVVLADEHTASIADHDRKLKDLTTLFHTRDLSIAQQVLDRYSIDYLVITEDMKKGLIWNTKHQGLLFLLGNNETFKNVYVNEEVEVWKVLP